jgi:Protein of unknown function (DUF2911).
MRFTAVLCLVLVAAPACSRAQSIRKSQLATVSQMIGDARIEIIYRRPVARGRDLFGSLVPFGQVWSPSADSAAVFITTKELEIAGAKLPAGRYSMWAIPDRDSWTLIFNSVTPVFHMRYPNGKDVLRVHAKPRAADHMETLAFYFPMVDEDSAVLNLHWGKTIVPFAIRARQ